MTSAHPAVEDDPSRNIGRQLRRARTEANLSLREVARQLGVSPSFVSQLENGKSKPSVATLYAFAQLLGVSIDRLFETKDAWFPAPLSTKSPEGPADGHAGASPQNAVVVSRSSLGSPADPGERRRVGRARLSVTAPGDRTRLVMDTGVIWDQLARNTGHHIDFMEIHYPPGSSSTTDDRMLRHDGYEYGYLLEGELQVTVGFEEFTLHAGEAMGLDSSVPHLFKNVESVPARGIWYVDHRYE